MSSHDILLVQNLLQKEHTLPENTKDISVNISLGHFCNYVSLCRQKSKKTLHPYFFIHPLRTNVYINMSKIHLHW